ncbi:hypothetical protein J6590_042652 [Homalodisca vitripennis]|nr:hypothetical protein J6590_042652 [Homalodisca vitripennis]
MDTEIPQRPELPYKQEAESSGICCLKPGASKVRDGQVLTGVKSFKRSESSGDPEMSEARSSERWKIVRDLELPNTMTYQKLEMAKIPRDRQFP